MERAAAQLRELIYQRNSRRWIRAVENSLLIYITFAFLLRRVGVSANNRTRRYPASGGRYNRINHKSSAFPRKRISVIYARRMVRSAKETGGAIARLKHYNEARNKFAKRRNDFLKFPTFAWEIYRFPPRYQFYRYCRLSHFTNIWIASSTFTSITNTLLHLWKRWEVFIY